MSTDNTIKAWRNKSDVTAEVIDYLTRLTNAYQAVLDLGTGIEGCVYHCANDLISPIYVSCIDLNQLADITHEEKWINVHPDGSKFINTKFNGFVLTNAFYEDGERIGEI